MTDHRVVHLEQQIEMLLREKSAALQALELAGSLGSFSNAFSQLDQSDAILGEICSRARSMIRFHAVSIYLVSEEDNDLRQAWCDVPDKVGSMERQVGELIADQSCAFALQGTGPSFFLSEDRCRWLLLHPLSTPARTRGMFVGLLDEDKDDILDTTLRLFTVVMLAAAHALESFELYRLFRAHRRELEDKVGERTHELQEANAQLHAIQDAMPVGLLIFDVDSGRVVSANPAALALLGCALDQVLGLEDAALFEVSTQEELSLTGTAHVEMILRTVTGQRIPVLCSVGSFRLRGRQHRIRCFLDMTEQKNFVRLKEDVERIARHDLKTPLNGIIAIPDLLLDTPLDGEQRELVQYLRDAGRKMLGLINSSLDMLKMECGSYNYVPLPVNLLQILRGVLRDTDRLLQQKQVRPAVTLNGASIAVDDRLEVPGEELLTYSLFANLITNAVEASPVGESMEVEIVIGSDVLVHIRNRGCVPEDIRARFFDKYVTAGKVHGSGLGTYSARLMAQTMGGSVDLDTATPGETTVSVRLPL